MKTAVPSERHTPIDIDDFSQGLVAMPDTDERLAYLQYVKILGEDSAKHDIAFGLGTLGLIAMQAEDLQQTSPTAQRYYAATLLDYATRLRSRSRTLRAPGQLESPDFQERYPGAEPKWAHEYAGQLGTLHDLVVDAPLFDVVKKVYANNYMAIRRLQTGRDKRSVATEVRLNRDGKPTVVNVPKGFAQNRRRLV